MAEINYKLQIGEVTVEHPFSRVPKAEAEAEEEWMVYFNINDHKFHPMVGEFCRLVAERLQHKSDEYLLVMPETSTIGMAYILRAQYGFSVQLIGKKKRPDFSAQGLSESYSPITSTATSTLYFDGWDQGIEAASPLTGAKKSVVIVDNVVTSGQTLSCVVRLLLRYDPLLTFKEAIVMWTEGSTGAFSSLPVQDGLDLPLYSVGGHIPILTTAQLLATDSSSSSSPSSPSSPSSSASSAVVSAAPPARFFFQSSSRFPCHFDPSKNILFSVFQSLDGTPAIAVVGPSTFTESKLTSPPSSPSPSSSTLPPNFSSPSPDFSSSSPDFSSSSPSSSSSSPPFSSSSSGKNKLWYEIPVRVHDACLTSECFFSTKCDCREQLAQSVQYIVENSGIVIYLFQEGRGIGIAQKIRAYFLQTMAMLDTVEANRALGLPDDAREYLAVRDILNHFHIGSIRLMTNNPRKIAELSKLGINVCGRISAEVTASTPQTAKYLHDKAVFMGHLIESARWDEQLKAPTLVAPILFYEPHEAATGWLSNFYMAEIEIAGRRYPSTEHYYQSRKFDRPDSQAVFEAIIAAPTPDDAFRLSRQHADLVHPHWNTHKKRDMFRAVITKFKQHADLRKKLIATGEAPLVENSPVDSFWGCGADGKGQNLLGHMLMNIRQMLIEHVFDPSAPLG